MSEQLFACPCCGSSDYSQTEILWPGLIKEWQLSSEEAAYINRQQGMTCTVCHSNLRSMTLARAIMGCYGYYEGTLQDFLTENSDLRILELNEAGHLTHFFEGMKHHTLATYPEVKIEKLPYDEAAFNLVIHSDTLEHVEDPIKGLRETHRVLKPGGFTCYTTPIVVGRLSKRRPGEEPSFHGSPGNDEYLVRTEFGSNVWTQVIEAGFWECRLTSLEYPSSVCVTGFRKPEPNVIASKPKSRRRFFGS